MTTSEIEDALRADDDYRHGGCTDIEFLRELHKHCARLAEADRREWEIGLDEWYERYN